MIKKSILLILPAEDFNEEEFLTVKNLLEKSNYKIFIASDAHTLCTGCSGLKVRADVSFYNMNENNFAGIVFIGGKGVKSYWNNPFLHRIANKFNTSRKMIAAICSAPVLLARAGILANYNATRFPEDRKELEREGVEFKDSAVVVSKNIITAQAPFAASDFTNTLIEQLS